MEKKFDFNAIIDSVIDMKNTAVEEAKIQKKIYDYKTQIKVCQEVIDNNYKEIGRLYYQSMTASEEPVADYDFEGQIKKITNAKNGILQLEKKINDLKKA